MQNRLGEILQNRGLTATGLAEKLAVSTSTICRIIGGSRKPSIALAQRICRALCEDVDVVFPPPLDVSRFV